MYSDILDSISDWVFTRTNKKPTKVFFSEDYVLSFNATTSIIVAFKGASPNSRKLDNTTLTISESVSIYLKDKDVINESYKIAYGDVNEDGIDGLRVYNELLGYRVVTVEEINPVSDEYNTEVMEIVLNVS